MPIYIVCVSITIPIICIPKYPYLLVLSDFCSHEEQMVFGHIWKPYNMHTHISTTIPILKWASLLSFADMLTWHLSGWSYHWCLSPALESVQDPNVMPNYLSIQVSKTVIIHEKESEIGRMLAPTHEEDFSSKWPDLLWHKCLWSIISP